MIGRMIGGMSLFIGIFGLYKLLLPGYWEYTLQRSGLYAELPFTSIAVNVNDPTVSMAINTAMIVVGLYMIQEAHPLKQGLKQHE